MTSLESKKQASALFAQLAEAIETGSFGAGTTVALTTLGSELGVEELVRGAEMAVEQNPGLKVVLVGPKAETNLPIVESTCEADSHSLIEKLL
ncbi:MAG: glycine reductase, partial [Eubacteriales bacterium]|nr:glycine reductase [Eubacteriales bacterium]